MDFIMMVNIVSFALILTIAMSGGGFVAVGMAMFYGSYISIDAFWLWSEGYISSLTAIQYAKFSSVMYLLVSICCAICMLYFFVVALFKEQQAKLSFVIATYIAVYYLAPNLIQAGVINYSTGLIPYYEYWYDYSVIVDLLFVLFAWLGNVRGGNEWSKPIL